MVGILALRQSAPSAVVEVSTLAALLAPAAGERIVCVTYYTRDTAMGHRVNILLEDEVWTALSRLPRGERSRAVNKALARWFVLQERHSAADRLKQRRASLQPLPGASEEWIRQDRDAH